MVSNETMFSRRGVLKNVGTTVAAVGALGSATTVEASETFDNPHLLDIVGSGGPIEYDIQTQPTSPSTPDPEGSNGSIERNDEYDTAAYFLRGTVNGGQDQWKLENPIEHDGEIKGHEITEWKLVNESDSWARVDLTWNPSGDCWGEYVFNVNHLGSGEVDAKFRYPCECSVRYGNGDSDLVQQVGENWEIYSQLNDNNFNDDYWANGRLISATISMDPGSGVHFYQGPRP